MSDRSSSRRLVPPTTFSRLFFFFRFVDLATVFSTITSLSTFRRFDFLVLPRRCFGINVDFFLFVFEDLSPILFFNVFPSFSFFRGWGGVPLRPRRPLRVICGGGGDKGETDLENRSSRITEGDRE